MFNPFNKVRSRSEEVTETIPKDDDGTNRIIKQYKSDKFLIDLFTKSKDCLYKRSSETVGRVYLVNPKECAINPQFNATYLSESFRSIIGKREWEVALAGLLVKAVFDWKMSDNNYAEVTEMFNRDYYSMDNKKMYTNIDILKKMGKCFEIVEVKNSRVYIKWNLM